MRKYCDLPYTEYPVSEGNYNDDRKPIDLIILHSTNSTYQSAINWFGNPKAGTSAHYIISNKGELAAMLEEYFVAFHSGNYAINQRSIGIEHEGYQGMIRTNEEYITSAKLVADICKYYNIPCDRDHIKPHREIVPTACPTDLEVDKIIKMAQNILSPDTSSSTTMDKIRKYFNTNISEDDVIKFIEERKAEINKLNEAITQKDQTLTNLNQQINDRNLDITRLNGDNKLLADQLKDCEFRATSSLEQAVKLPELQKLSTEQGTKINGLKQEIDSLNRAIGQYKAKLDFSKLPWKLALMKLYELITKT